MNIDPKLIDLGIDEYLIKILHSKTKLSKRVIESAELINSRDGKQLIKLELTRESLSGLLSSTRTVVLNIDKNRIREIKLNMILNGKG